MTTAKGFIRVEQLIPFEVDIDTDELSEWLDGAPLTDERLTEYLQSPRDWWERLSLEEPSWKHEVTDYDVHSAAISAATEGSDYGF